MSSDVNGRSSLIRPRMTRREFLQLASATAVLAGCGSSDNTTPSGTAATGAAQTPSPAPMPAPAPNPAPAPAPGMVSITQQPTSPINISAGSTILIAAAHDSSGAPMTATLVWAATSQPATIPGVSVQMSGDQIFLVTTSSAQVGSFRGLAVAVQDS